MVLFPAFNALTWLIQTLETNRRKQLTPIVQFTEGHVGKSLYAVRPFKGFTIKISQLIAT